MVIILNKVTIPDIPHLVFCLEKKDFINEIGHKFILELKYRLSGNYVVEQFQGKLVWIVDLEHIDIFVEVYKKYFKENFKTQKVKVLCPLNS